MVRGCCANAAVPTNRPAIAARRMRFMTGALSRNVFDWLMAMILYASNYAISLAAQAPMQSPHCKPNLRPTPSRRPGAGRHGSPSARRRIPRSIQSVLALRLRRQFPVSRRGWRKRREQSPRSDHCSRIGPMQSFQSSSSPPHCVSTETRLGDRLSVIPSLSSAQSLSKDSAKLRMEVDRFLVAVRAA